MRLARRYLVRGRVQGVGFRYYVYRAAMQAGVKGWVRNNPDGTVEIAAAGEPEALTRLEQDIQEGPRGSRVDDVQVSDDPGRENHTDFTIR
jgi:acylphosphatase